MSEPPTMPTAHLIRAGKRVPVAFIARSAVGDCFAMDANGKLYDCNAHYDRPLYESDISMMCSVGETLVKLGFYSRKEVEAIDRARTKRFDDERKASKQERLARLAEDLGIELDDAKRDRLLQEIR